MFKNIGLLFLLLIILFTSLILPIKTSAFNFNPISFLQRTTNIIISRASDIIYYLIMQKRYIFNDFSDPNRYSSLDIPIEVEQVLSSSTSSTTNSLISNKPISVTTSTVPGSIIQNIKPISATSLGESQDLVSIPAVIIKADSSSNLIEDSIPFIENNSQILKYTNQERIKMSLKSLISNNTLDLIADLRIDDLFSNQYFEHTSPDGKTASDLAHNLNYEYLLIGENLALGDFDGEKEIVSAWMDSPGHRANILNGKYTELGTSIKEGLFNGEKTIIAVQIFSLPFSDCSRPNSDTKALIDSSTISIQKMQEDALLMYDDLNTMKNSPNLDRGYYSQKIQEYNYFARKVNDAIVALKEMIDIYNLEVEEYNSCIGS